MRRRFGILLLIVCVAAPARALPLRHFGIKGGYTAATQVWDHDVIKDDELTMLSSYHLGVFTEWLEWDHLSVIVGFNFEQKGAGYESQAQPGFIPGGSGRSLTGHSHTQYLSIPILGKFRMEGNDLVPYLLAGPRIDYFLGFTKEDEDDLEWGIEDDWDRWVFGLTTGIGLEASVLSGHQVFLEFVFNYDPFWFYEHTSELSGYTIRIKNRSLNVSLGLGF